MKKGEWQKEIERKNMKILSQQQCLRRNFTDAWNNIKEKQTKKRKVHAAVLVQLTRDNLFKGETKKKRDELATGTRVLEKGGKTFKESTIFKYQGVKLQRAQRYYNVTWIDPTIFKYNEKQN